MGCAFNAQGMTQEDHNAINRTLINLKSSVENLNSIAESKTPLRILTMFENHLDIPSLNSYLKKFDTLVPFKYCPKVKEGLVDIRRLEVLICAAYDVFLQNNKSLLVANKDQVQNSTKRRIIIKPTKYELFISGTSLLAFGGLLGWLAHSWYTSK